MTTRYIIRPASCTSRAARCGAPSAARTMSYYPYPAAALQQRFSSPAVTVPAFGDMFRLFDESARALDTFQSLFADHPQRPAFAPRFDIQEVDGAYQLRGELPGVDPKNVNVEFTDPKTLVISGSTEREVSSASDNATAAPTSTEEATEPVNAVASQPEIDAAETASTHSGSSYQQPTVEDDYVDAGEEASSSAAPAPQATEPTKTVAAAEIPAEKKEQQNKYWISERSVGRFSRTFTFAANVDQNAVTAKMENGILSISVPKAKKPEVRRIVIE